MFIKFESLDFFIEFIQPIMQDLKTPILMNKPKTEVKDFYTGNTKSKPKMHLVLLACYENNIIYCIQLVTEKNVDSFIEKTLDLKPLLIVNEISIIKTDASITIK